MSVFSTPLSPQKQLEWLSLFLVVAMGCLFMIFHTFMVDAITARQCDFADGTMALPQERLPVYASPKDLDGVVWNQFANNLGTEGSFRLSYTFFDNAPEGRAVYWNSGFAWYLRGLGMLRHAWVPDEPFRNSLYRMSIWANPLLFLLSLVGVVLLAAYRFGPFFGAVMGFGMLTTSSYFGGFLPTTSDHHGLISLTLLGLFFGILWGGGGFVFPSEVEHSIFPTTVRQARLGMIIAAISAATGLWVSALSMTIGLCALGIGVLIASFVFAKKALAAGFVFYPSLWKTWAGVGAIGSLFYYFLEHFPHLRSMRLEINHPLYALSFVGGGWLIALVHETFFLEAQPKSSSVGRWLGAGIALLVLPISIWVGGERFFIPLDPFMLKVHQCISEFMPASLLLEQKIIRWSDLLDIYGWLIPVAVWVMVLKRTDRGTKWIFLYLTIQFGTLSSLVLIQYRWGMLAGPAMILFSAILISYLWKNYVERSAYRWLFGMIFVLSAAGIAYRPFSEYILWKWGQYNAPSGKVQMTAEEIRQLLHRDIAKVIQQNAAKKPVVLLGSPNSGCLIAAMGNFQTIGTLYWENRSGLEAAGQVLTAQTNEDALAFLRQHGVTHIALMPWENFIPEYFRILYPQKKPGYSVENSFGFRLMSQGIVPNWLTPIPYPESPYAKALNQKVFLFEIKIP